MRGLASLGVIFNHLAVVFIPGLYFTDQAKTAFEVLFVGTPLNVIANGNISVQFFFFISGFLIAKKLYKIGKSNGILPSAVKQASKLAWLVIPAILFSFILMNCGAMYHLRALALNPKLSFVETYNNFSPTIPSLVIDFFKTFVSTSLYVGPLWTIKHELLGSLLVMFATYYVARSGEKKYWYGKVVYVLLMISIIRVDTYIITFLLGALVYDCFYYLDTDNSLFGKIVRKLSYSRISRIILFLIAIYLCCTPSKFVGWWAPFRSVPAPHFFRAAGIALFTYLVVLTGPLKKVFSFRPFVWLGSISAYTYIFHWPIILSLGCFIYVKLHATVSYYPLTALIAVVCIFVTLAMSFAYVKAEKKIKLFLSGRKSGSVQKL